MTRSEKSRQIVERIVVEGTLKLITPTSLSNGDADGLTDISLIKDEISEHALLTGTSVCGALRSYLRECSLGYEQTEESKYYDKKGKRLKQKDSTGKDLKDSKGDSINVPLPVITKLFGNIEDDGSQSLLIIDDAVSTKKPKTELRDGVKICGKTRTAEEGKKFDLELLETGTEFLLRFELLICEGENRNELVSALATALQGFEEKEIYLGGRKRRGYGECEVKGWKVKSYDLEAKSGLLEWLKNNDTPLNEIVERPIALALGVAPNADNRNYFQLDATFAIDGSILIRSGSKVTDKYQPDSVHLRSNKLVKDANGNFVREANGKLKLENSPIISGTSLAGVLRHRATKIVNTLKSNDDGKFVESMFGVDMKELTARNKVHKQKNESLEVTFASRLEVSETVIKNTKDLVHTRVKIDRFTGGAFDSALFDAAPVFSDGEQNAVNLKLRLRNAQHGEIGLILLLLKDLWTSDLTLGGESSIGRGRLKGKTACLNYKNGSGSWHSNMERIDDNKVKIDGIENNTEKIDLLNKFVSDFNHKLNPKEQNNV